MNNLTIKENIKIEDMIYEIRGKQVMIDSDLAKLFEYETFNLNKAVTRNINKFSDDYMFVLKSEEYYNLKFQNGISSYTHGGRRTCPRVFTEKGILMIATILKSGIAIEMSIKIINTFVLMRKYLSTNIIEQKYINDLVYKHENEIKILNNSLDKLQEKQKTNHIFFEGQIYDAYSLLIDILNKAKKEIIMIDNYAGKELFDILRNINCNIKIVTKNIDEESIKKYNKQYSNIEIIINDKFHDRFIILDNNILYHSGASFKDIGKKCFAISKIEDEDFLNTLKEKITN